MTDEKETDGLVWFSGNYCEFSFEPEDVADICRSGPNDAAVAYVTAKPRIKEQIEAISEAKIRAEVDQWFYEPEDKDADLDKVHQRLVWCAAWQIHDEESQSFKEATSD